MADINPQNWLSLIPDETNLKDINLPGAHDASTKFCQLSLFSCCQSLSIKEMLAIGVRCFDLRVNGDQMVHSFTKCKKSRFGKPLKIFDVIEDIKNFLASNPTEAVLVFLKNDGKISGKDCLDFFKENIIKGSESIWYLENRIPCLFEARGKIILLNRIDSSSGLDFSKMPYQGGMKNPAAEDFSPDGKDSVTVQDWFFLPKKRKWLSAVKPLLENEKQYSGKLIVNYLSSAGLPYIPQLNAAYINKKFLNFKLNPGGHYGIIMADFLNTELSEKIIKSNF